MILIVKSLISVVKITLLLNRLDPKTISPSPSIPDDLPGEHLFSVSSEPWFTDIVNFLAAGAFPTNMTPHEKRNFVIRTKGYFWDNPHLFKEGADGILHRCIPESERSSVLAVCHSMQCGGHYSGKKMTSKVLQSGFF